MIEQIVDLWKEFQQSPSYLTVITVVSLILFLIIWKITLMVVNHHYKKRLLHVNERKDSLFKGLKIGSYEIVNPHLQRMVLVNFYKILRIVALLSVLTGFALFLTFINPLSKELLLRMGAKLVTPIISIGHSILDYIPKLVTIIIIVYVIRMLIKVVNYFSTEIKEKRLVIKRMYPEWADPTAAALKVLLYIIGIVLIAPYLPGSSSGAFKGISVMVGILVSIGSSSSVGNAIAGLILTYMRSFKVGDRVRIDGTEGVVVEKSLLVTRIRTLKNERVTIPNGEILSNPIVNLTYSAHNYNLTIFTSVTIGYDVEWRRVHELLLNAAQSVEEVLEDPAPFVLQVALNDFYVEYQLNARIKSSANMPQIKSRIHENIQDNFREANIEILSPHYRMQREDKPFNSGYRIEDSPEDN